VASDSIPAEGELEYVKSFHGVDPRIPLLLQREPGDWLFCQDKFDERVAVEQVYYRDLLIPYGGRYSATMKVSQTSDETVLLALLSRIDRGRFNAAQMDFIRRIGIHLTQSIAMFRKFRQLQKGAVVGAGLIERIKKPIFVMGVDRQLNVLNSAGSAMLTEPDTPFRIAEGRLHARNADVERLLTVEAIGLQRLVARQSDDRFVPLNGSGTGKWIAVSVAHFAPQETMRAFGNVGQIILTAHPRESSPIPDPALLQAALGLTRAEARIASLIYGGYALRAAADEMSIAESTAKTHLQAVFNKTAVSKQTELVRLIAGLF